MTLTAIKQLKYSPFEQGSRNTYPTFFKSDLWSSSESSASSTLVNMKSLLSHPVPQGMIAFFFKYYWPQLKGAFLCF